MLAIPLFPTVAPTSKYHYLPKKFTQAIHKYSVIKHAAQLNKILDDYEKNAANVDKDQAKFLLKKCLRCMKKITEAENVTPELKTAYNDLRGRFCSLKYRTFSVQERVERPSNVPTVKELSKKIAAHKAKHPVISQLLKTDQAVSKHELEILDNLINHYPEMAVMINEDPIALKSFFTLVCHRNIPLDVFVQFPSTITKLSSLITTRFGHFENFLKVENATRPGGKQLTIPYMHQSGPHRVNILNPSALLHLENNVTITVAQLYKHIMQKPLIMGSVEIFPEGIRHFDAGQFVGANGPIDLSGPEWYKQLPAWETLTVDQANTKYGKSIHGDPLDGTNWMVALCVSAKNKGKPDASGILRPDVIDVHGYQVFLIPSGDGKYHVIPLCKVPKKSPDMRSPKELIKFVANTDFAEIQYDTNYFTDSRLHGMICYSLPQDQGQYYMNNIIGRDIQAGRDGKLIFQFADQNCTEWVFTRWKELRNQFPAYHQRFPLPNHLVSLLKTSPSHPALKHFVKKLGIMPAKLRKIFLRATMLFLRAKRGHNINGNHYSMWTSRNFTSPHYIINNPVRMFDYKCPDANKKGHHCVRQTTHKNI